MTISLDFSIIGSYQLDHSIFVGLLSKGLDYSATPSFAARAVGSVRVGSTVFAVVDLEGTVLETSLPLTVRQEAATWPMLAR